VTQQGQYEYKLEIGSLSSEVDQIFLKSWKVNEGRDIDKYSTATLELIRTADAQTILVGDEVRYWRRIPVEATWGPTFFLGYVTKTSKQAKNNTLTIEAKGYLNKIKGRNICSAEWGNTHIVDEELACNSTNGLGFDLDADLAPQVPLERVRFLRMSMYVNSGQRVMTTNVNDSGAGVWRKVAQTFLGQSSLLRKMWVKGYRAAPTTSALRVEVRPDNNGVPSATVVTSYDIPAASFGAGAGAASWVEVDLLRHVADPEVLILDDTLWYWLVFSIVTPGANEWYHLSMALKGLPSPSTMVDDVGAGWAASPHNCLLYALDRECDWSDVEEGLEKDYIVYQKRLIIQKGIDYGSPGTGKFAGRIKPTILFDGQKVCRATYWKGTLVYATILDAWAKQVASDIYDILDISVTEPTLKQQCIKVENSDGLAVFRILRQYAPYVCRIYMDASNQIVFEVRDEKPATTTAWNLYSANDKSLRTFEHGDDATLASRIRIFDLEIEEEIESEVTSMLVMDSGGAVGGIVGVGSIVASGRLRIGGLGASIGSAIDFGDPFVGPGYMVRLNGRVTLSGIDQSFTQGPFRKPNELIKILALDFGLNNQILAIENITWSGGLRKTTQLEIDLVDTIFERHVPAYHKGGPGTTYNAPAAKTFSGVSELLRASDGRAFTSLQQFGVTDTPEAYISKLGMSGRAVEPVLHTDGGIVYSPLYYWWISIGTGIPAGGALGNRVAEVQADVKTVGPVTYLTAKFHPSDLHLASTWPQEIKEIGVRRSSDEMKTGISNRGAYTLGVPDGSYTIFGPRPLMGPEKRIIVTIKVAAPPP